MNYIQNYNKVNTNINANNGNQQQMIFNNYPNNNNNTLLISQPQQIMQLIGYKVINADHRNRINNNAFTNGNNGNCQMVPLYKLETVHVQKVICLNAGNPNIIHGSNINLTPNIHNININQINQRYQIQTSVPNVVSNNNKNDPNLALSNVECTQITTKFTLNDPSSTDSVTTISSSSSSSTSSTSSTPSLSCSKKLLNDKKKRTQNIKNIYKCDKCDKEFKHECM